MIPRSRSIRQTTQRVDAKVDSACWASEGPMAASGLSVTVLALVLHSNLKHGPWPTAFPMQVTPLSIAAISPASSTRAMQTIASKLGGREMEDGGTVGNHGVGKRDGGPDLCGRMFASSGSLTCSAPLATVCSHSGTHLQAASRLPLLIL